MEAYCELHMNDYVRIYVGTLPDHDAVTTAIAHSQRSAKEELRHTRSEVEQESMARCAARGGERGEASTTGAMPGGAKGEPQPRRRATGARAKGEPQQRHRASPARAKT